MQVYDASLEYKKHNEDVVSISHILLPIPQIAQFEEAHNFKVTPTTPQSKSAPK